MVYSSISRRKFLNHSFQTLLLLGLPTYTLAQTQVDWKEAWQQNQNANEGKLKVLALLGEAEAKTPLKVGDEISSNQMIEVAPESKLYVGLPDGSAIELQEKSQSTFSLQADSGGIVNLRKGGLTGAISRTHRRRYLVRTPTAVFGVKGTVFHGEALSEIPEFLPETTRDYICLCNGNVDFLNPDDQSPLFEEVSEYHNAFCTITTPTGEIDYTRVPYLYNHSDPSIRTLMDRGNVDHDRAWLRR